MNKYSPWPNSRVDRGHNVIYLSNVNISHSGVYTCHIEYNDSFSEEREIHLTVTANYSQPSIRLQNCTEQKDQCLVLCSSRDGYPKGKIKWNIAGLNKTDTMLWSKDIISEDSSTSLYNISSMASFNCSTGKQQDISCSVDSVSKLLSICHQKNTPEKQSHVEAIVSCVVVLVIVIVIAITVGLYRIRNQSSTNANADNSVIYSPVVQDAL
ncbi:hypothetical protein WMY93_029461 [Mugilogobius chulae]|uniref:CD80-like immunoglobulin C2-set domain-containing protein n=1 Tax=Mugilogobius chulae TaxID=88201 RepID=A0AAW0MVX5_9GOBI